MNKIFEKKVMPDLEKFGVNIEKRENETILGK